MHHDRPTTVRCHEQSRNQNPENPEPRNAIYFDSSKNAWIITDSGLSQIVDERWLNYSNVRKTSSLQGLFLPYLIDKGTPLPSIM